MLKRRIMIVDDHPMYRVGLRRLLESDQRLAVVAEAENGHQALHEADIHKPAVVLMDVQLPGVTGLHVASALRRERPTTAVIFLSMHVDDDRLFSAVRVGAAAYLTKDADPQKIIDTVHHVLKGENLLHQAVLTNPELARRVLGEFRSLSDGTGVNVAEVVLSPRELEVLDCLVMGHSNKEIGDALFITEQTVKNHMTSVLRKLQVDDRVAALRYAVTRRWAEIGPQNYAAVEQAMQAEQDVIDSASPAA
ncbi:MAG TPA: response regulator transcription factor [Thermomicrobiales bacterium]|nr:response regulator transcription factor [Thermomicrobiales bacterium]